MSRIANTLFAACLAALPLPALAMSAEDARFFEEHFEGVYSQPDRYVGSMAVAQSLLRVAHVDGELFMAFSRRSLEPVLESVDRGNRSFNFRQGEGGALATFQRAGGMAVLTTPGGGSQHLTFVRRPAAEDYDTLGEAHLIANGHDVESAERIVASRGSAQPSQPRGDSESGQGPAFDCGRAGSQAERMVCSDEELSRLDRRLAELFGRVVAADDAEFWRADQREWLTHRDACPSVECMVFEYRDRLQELGDVANYLSKPAESR